MARPESVSVEYLDIERHVASQFEHDIVVAEHQLMFESHASRGFTLTWPTDMGPHEALASAVANLETSDEDVALIIPRNDKPVLPRETLLVPSASVGRMYEHTPQRRLPEAVIANFGSALVHWSGHDATLQLSDNHFRRPAVKRFVQQTISAEDADAFQSFFKQIGDETTRHLAKQRS